MRLDGPAGFLRFDLKHGWVFVIGKSSVPALEPTWRPIYWALRVLFAVISLTEGEADLSPTSWSSGMLGGSPLLNHTLSWGGT
jgi:hypothetical protein